MLFSHRRIRIKVCVKFCDLKADRYVIISDVGDKNVTVF